jgi:RNA polymerase sigma-70 factor (ECF subfamily)
VGPPAEALRPALVRVARRFLRDDHEAEEVAQEALLIAWQRSGELRDPRRFFAWVYRTAINLALNRRRKRRPVQLDHEPMADGGLVGRPQGTAACERQELADRVRLALTDLPERQQAALVLRDMEGLPYEQIAVIMETRAGAARILVHRGRETLRQTLLRRWPDSFT